MKKTIIYFIVLLILIYPFSIFAEEIIDNDNTIVEKELDELTTNVEEEKSEYEIEEKQEENSEDVEELVGEIDKSASVLYRTHIETNGWEKSFKKDGEVSGTTGKSKRLEAIEIKLNTKLSGSIEYRTHIQDIGWETNFKKDGQLSGTTGKSKRLESIEIKLSGEISNYYDIYYRVHAESIGWMTWTSNGEKAGTQGFSYRLEAIEIVLVEKGQSPPERTNNVDFAYKIKRLSYESHIQNIGWQNGVADGQLSGTIGKSKRMEAISIKLVNQIYTGDIEYRAYVQNYGWLPWKKNGNMAGTSGESKRMEAIQIKLTGEIANHYDIYYRVHAQNFGWMAWGKNGESAGTAHHSCRLEAIEIVLVEKGQVLENKSDTKTNKAFVEDSGWVIMDGKKYYIYSDGTRAKFFSKINGRRYEFTANGELQHEDIKLVIDVSAHNKVIDWEKLWKSGEIDGVIVRVAAGDEKVDAQFIYNMSAITQLKIPYGFYIYSYAENYKEGKEYAEFLKSNAGPYLNGETLGVYFDLEENVITSYLNTSNYNDIVRGFLDVLPQAKVYTYTDYSNRVLNSDYLRNLTTWIANYAVTDCPGNYRGWQYTSKGRASGISTDVDFSVFYY